ncbi:MAG TPA: STAS domain-containing protein [Rectinemataceae bacterium]|nr:STAS domain-containing protein [Rectinemataceae bacterium]
MSVPDSALHEKIEGFNAGHPRLKIRCQESQSPRGLVLAATGNLDADSSADFQLLAIDSLSEAKRIGGLIIDLEGVSYLSSLGVGALSALLVSTRNHQIDLHLSRLQEGPRSVLEVLGFLAFFDCIDGYEISP